VGVSGWKAQSAYLGRSGSLALAAESVSVDTEKEQNEEEDEGREQAADNAADVRLVVVLGDRFGRVRGAPRNTGGDGTIWEGICPAAGDDRDAGARRPDGRNHDGAGDRPRRLVLGHGSDGYSERPNVTQSCRAADVGDT
jgi:hypothetical protein